MSYRGQGGQGGQGRGRGDGRGAGQRGGRGDGAGFRGAQRGAGRGGAGRGDGAGFRGGERGGFRGPPRGGGGGSGFRGAGRATPAIFKEGSPAMPDDRLRDNDLNALVSSFRNLQVASNDPRRPLRPGFGTQGTPITLRANFFPYRLPKDLVVYEYRVEISPQTALKRRMFKLLEESPQCRPFIKHIAHDGSEKLVSSKPLPQPLNISIVFREEGEAQPRANAKVYNMSIALTTTIDTRQLPRYLAGQDRNYNIAPLLAALNLVQQRHASQHGIRVGKGRYFFPLQSQTYPLGPGVIAVQGYYASVRPVYKELMVNVNVCTSAFLDLPGNMADALFNFSGRSSGAMPTLPPNLLRNLKVTTTYLGYKKRLKVYAIGTTSARNTFFKHDQYGQISVENYFKKVYPQIKLRYPTDLPVINTGSAKKPTYIPAELCDIEPGQLYGGKLSGKETAQMIKVACNPPNVNAEAIVGEGFTKLGITPPADVLGAFGISISNEMTVVPGRELPPPRLLYGRKQVMARDGAWNIVDVKFSRGAQIKSWWMMVVRDSMVPNGSLVGGPGDPNLTRLRDNFAAKLRSSGMTIPGAMPRLSVTPLLPPIHADPSRKAALNALRTTFRDELQKAGGQKPDFILVLLSYTDNYIYPGIKRICDVELGLNTVHLQLDKATAEGNRQDQYLSNVALKINTKCGGINHQLDENTMSWMKRKKTMMVGIDVTHRGPQSREGAPSIAAVVASVDDNFVQYPASIVLELKEMMVERLQTYRDHNRTLPERVFVFRDGVSEGQYDTVLEQELPQILEAFKRFDTKQQKTPYRPLLSIVICGKRHHAKFFPTNAQNASKNMNTRPGTVVDKGVTGVFDFDFYLQAHAGLQGTVKSTHYIVIYDENRFAADEIQQGINSSSYLYARATRAVSLMPPAYYADQACERGRYYLHDFLSGDGSEMASVGRGALAREAEKQAVFEAAKKAWGEGFVRDPQLDIDVELGKDFVSVLRAYGLADLVFSMENPGAARSSSSVVTASPAFRPEQYVFLPPESPTSSSCPPREAISALLNQTSSYLSSNFSSPSRRPASDLHQSNHKKNTFVQMTAKDKYSVVRHHVVTRSWNSDALQQKTHLHHCLDSRLPGGAWKGADELRMVFLAHRCTPVCLISEADARGAGITCVRPLSAVDYNESCLVLQLHPGLGKRSVAAIDAEPLPKYSKRPRFSSEDLPRMLDCSFPIILSQNEKDDIVREFRSNTSDWAMKRYECSFCGVHEKAADIKMYTRDELDISNLEAAVEGIRRISKQEHVYAYKSSSLLYGCYAVCHFCNESISCKRFKTLPLRSYANGTWIGDLPAELQGLSLLEEQCISRVRATRCMFKLTYGPAGQFAARGNVCILPQNVVKLMDTLPPPISSVMDECCVILVGSLDTEITAEKLRRTPLLVRRNVIRRALRWLIANNPHYSDLDLNDVDRNLQE
ncbi:hypothetical protein VNI00_013147 [Paramarasmius palmivorus]|uniref:Uncharacterized protein n=1 Tax=Paramarasmius palmivorus TaxID=297713 RepID=A0AAW0C1D3_9AGAR